MKLYPTAAAQRDRRVFVDGRLDHCIDERFAHRGKIILGIEGIGNGSVLEIGVGGSAIVIHHPAKGEDQRIPVVER